MKQAIAFATFLATGLLGACESRIEVQVTSSGKASPSVEESVTNGGEVSAATSYPEAITSFTADVLSRSEIRLSWSLGRSDILALKLAHAEGSAAPANCQDGTVLDLTGDRMDRVVSGLALGTSYSFRICAQVGNSAPESKSITATTTGHHPPPEVTRLEAAATSDSKIKLTWGSGGEGTQGYRITYRLGSTAPDSCSAATQITEREISGTSYEISGLTPDRAHGFRVCSVGEGGSSISAGMIVSAKTLRQEMPPEPQGETVEALSSSSLTLSWSPGSGGATSGYVISHLVGSTPPASCDEGTKISGPITATTQVVTGLAHETAYSFRICAINANETPDVSAGVVLTVTTPSQEPPPDVVDLGATALSAKEVRLQWVSGGGSTANFRISYQAGVTPPASCADGTPVADSIISASTYVVSGLTRETAYSLRVCAANANASADISAGAAITVTTLSEPLPPNPIAPGLVVNSSSQITLTWSSDGGTTSGYRIAYQAGAVAPMHCTAGTAIPASAIAGTSHVITGLMQATQYSFRLCAINSNTVPDESAGITLTGTTSAEPPPPDVTAATANALSASAIELSWSSGGGTTAGYRVSYQPGTTAPTSCTVGTKITADAISGTSLIVTGLVHESPYAFRICAITASGAAMALGVVVTSTTQGQVPPPNPTSVMASPISSSQVSLSWSSGGGMTAAYRISYQPGSAAPASCHAGTQIPAALISGTTHVVSGLNHEAAYSFRICALNANATPDMSVGEVVSASTQSLPPPANPTSAATTINSDSAITLSWASGGGTTSGYRISYQPGTTAPASCEAGTQIPEDVITGTTHQVTGLVHETPYSFRICAINANGTPDLSEGATLTATTASQDLPPNPNSPSAVAESDTEIHVSWSSGGGTTAGYLISYQPGTTAPASCSVGTQISAASIAGTSHTVTGLSHETQYAFRVCAINANAISGISAGVTTATTTLGQPAPFDPTSLNAVAASASQINLSWASGGGTTNRYRISYQAGATAPASCTEGTTIAPAAISGTSHAVSGLTHETQYSFRICALNANSVPLASAGAVVSASTARQEAPPAPTGAVATATSDSTISLSWTSGGGTTFGYRISYQALAAPTSCADGTVIGENAISSASHVVTGLSGSTLYGFRICAINANATPDVSVAVTTSATTSITPPPPEVTGLSAVAISAGEIDLSWTSGGGTTAAYRIAYQAGSVAPASCSAGTQVGEASISGESHRIFGLVHEQQYAFRVCAITAAGASVAAGVTTTATTLGQAAPPEPSGLTASATAAAQITLTWTSGGATTGGYRISYQAAASAPTSCSAGTVISEGAISGTSHTVTGLTHETQYSFRVCAINANAVPLMSAGVTLAETTTSLAPPPNPTGEVAVPNSASQMTLSWTSGGGTTVAYRISYQAGSNAPDSCAEGTQISATEVNGTSHVITGLKHETPYSFRICALNANAVPHVSSGATATATTLSLPAPPNPVSLSATADSPAAITVSWSSGGGTTSGYRLTYQAGATAPASCTAGTQVSEASISGTSHAISGLTHEAQYSFRVCAINANASPTASVGATTSATTPSLPVPPNPTSLVATANTPTQITLSWSTGGGTTAGYRISYQPGPTPPASCSVGTQIAASSISGTSHIVTALTHETQYSFRVCAINANATPLASSGATTQTTTPSLAPPPDPSSATAAPQTSSEITLSWSSGGGSTSGYRVSYQPGATAPASCSVGTQIAESSITGTSHVVTGLTHETQYSFRICAINANATPNVSSGVSASATTPSLPVPPNPTGLSAMAASTTSMTLSWTSGGVPTSGYRIAYQKGAAAPTNCASGTQIGEGQISGTSKTISGLVPEQEYSFRACAINANAVPSVSSGATATQTTLAEAAPPNPVSPSATVSGTTIKLTWSSGGGTTVGYRISYQTGAAAPASCTAGTQIPPESISGTTRDVTALTANTQYSFRICALNGNAVPDVSNGVTVSATTVIICGGAGDSCYSNSAAMSAGSAVTPTGKNLTYVFANGSSGFKVWKEASGDRILQAAGFDGWQKSLNWGGKGWSASDFTSMSQIGGRVCPPNVYLDDANMFTTGNCLYYDTGNPAQAFNAASGTEGVDWLTYWDREATGAGTAASWFEGNIKTCNDKGMRLPTIYETTTTTITNSYYPTGNGEPVFAQGSGVPNFGSSYTVTATARTLTSANYMNWKGTALSGIAYGNSGNNVRCVMP